jgi:hypothetical protein
MTLIEDLEEAASWVDVGNVTGAPEGIAFAARLREHAKRLREHMEDSDWRVRLEAKAINGGPLATQEKQP